MKLDKHTLTEKKYYVLQKQLDELYSQKRNLPWRKLDEPYQDGWKIHLVLRDDIARSAKAPVINDLLKRFAKSDYVRVAKHISAIRRNPTLECMSKLFKNYRYNIGYDIRIKPISEKKYNELPDTHKKYFDLASPFLIKNKYHGQKMYECNIPDFYFIIKTNKRMITKIQDIDPTMEKQMAELKSLLEPYWRTLPYRYGWESHYENRSERRQSKIEISKMDYNDD